MAASLTDILTSLQNGVQAINNLATAWTRGQGNLTSIVITAQTLVTSRPCYLVSFNVIVAGAAGTINNAASTSASATTNAICATPATVGIYPVGSVCNAGIVANPGSGQSVVVTYYQ